MIEIDFLDQQQECHLLMIGYLWEQYLSKKYSEDSHETWYTVDDIINGKVPWFYKNGKQKSYIVHNDYGTIAAQMMPPLKSVKIVNF